LRRSRQPSLRRRPCRLRRCRKRRRLPLYPGRRHRRWIKSLETRLRQTKAIGVLTKLSLKNQVDDLVNRFRAYHRRQATTTLAELRRSYDMLLLKVLSLLQDSDPPLARDIVKSRAVIWGILEDPKKFTESNLMAGVAP
jgi:hypothetical protein